MKKSDLNNNVSYEITGHIGIHAGTDIRKSWKDVGNLNRMESLSDADLVALAQEVTGTDRSDLLESYEKSKIKWKFSPSFWNCYAAYVHLAFFPRGTPNPDDSAMIYSAQYFTKVGMCPSIRQHVIAQIEIWHFYDMSEGEHGREPFERREDGCLYSTRDGSTLVLS